VRAVIAEDSVLLREGVARVLGDAGFEVVGTCETADELLLKVRSYTPDVAIVDIRLPPTHNDEGLRAALEIRASHPSVGVLVLSQYLEVGLAMRLLGMASSSSSPSHICFGLRLRRRVASTSVGCGERFARNPSPCRSRRSSSSARRATTIARVTASPAHMIFGTMARELTAVDPPPYEEFVDLLRVRLGIADNVTTDSHSFKTLMKHEAEKGLVPDHWYHQAFDDLEAQWHLDPASPGKTGAFEAWGRLSPEGREYLKFQADDS
jgi:CheY-like chemotaxis protein